MRSGQGAPSAADDPLPTSKQALIYALITEFIRCIYFNTFTYIIHHEIELSDPGNPPTEILDMGSKREILTESSILPKLRGIFLASVIESEPIPEAWLDDAEYVELAQRIMAKSREYDGAALSENPEAVRAAMAMTAVMEATDQVIAAEGLGSDTDEEEEGEGEEVDEANERSEEEEWQEHCVCELCTEMRSHTELWEHWTPEPGTLEEILWRAVNKGFRSDKTE